MILLMASLVWLALEGETGGIIQGPGAGPAESTLLNVVQWMRLLVELTGALVIALGIMTAAYQFARALVPPQVESYNTIRLTLARYLALALEFQLGADLLSTAIAPTWTQIGKLGAIAFIRTALNFFLTREMREEKRGVSKDEGGQPEDKAAG